MNPSVTHLRSLAQQRPVFIPTMPFALVESICMKAHEKMLGEPADFPEFPEDVLLQCFDLEQNLVFNDRNNVSTYVKALLGRTRIILDNGYAEGKYTDDVERIDKMCEAVCPRIVVAAENAEDPGESAANFIGAHWKGGTDHKYMVVLPLTDDAEIHEAMDRVMDAIRWIPSIDIVWGIPKLLGERRSQTVKIVEDIILHGKAYDTRGRHIHLLGVVDKPTDLRTIIEVARGIDVTIDSTWPVYRCMKMAQREDAGDVKKHSTETWKELEAFAHASRETLYTFMENLHLEMEEWNVRGSV